MMNAKILIGEVSFEVTNATAAELIEFARLGNQAKQKDVVSVTREAIAPVKRGKRSVNYIPWHRSDLGFMAKMALDLGPQAKVPASAIAKAMKSQPSNKRAYNTLYAMAYNIARYLKEGKKGNLSKTNLAELADMGYTAAMMSAPSSNLLGDPMRIPVREA